MLRRIFIIVVLSQNNVACDSDADVLGDWVTVRAGTFTMGSPDGEEDRESDETQHEVRLTGDFEIQVTEVSESQFETLMGYNPSEFLGCSDGELVRGGGVLQRAVRARGPGPLLRLLGKRSVSGVRAGRFVLLAV